MMMKDMRILGGILLVSGTTIGAAMLALPVVSGFAGFVPSLALLLLFWLYMTLTAFLMLEVNLWMDQRANLITMAKETLGKWGQIYSWFTYLFLLYTLTTAYLAGSGPIFTDLILRTTGFQIPEWAGPLPLFIIFGFFVYQGARFVDYANRILMGGLILTFLIMIFLSTHHVNFGLLERANWTALWIPVSIVSTSFGFHIIIPTLTTYLDRDVKKLSLVLWVGSLLPLIIYVIWESLSLGIIPLNGDNGLAMGYREGLDGATLLSLYLQKGEISHVAVIFSLFAIVTSFLGVSLSLRDFLADGFKIRKDRKGKIGLYLLTFLPPLILTFTDPRAFLHALEYAGVFGVVTLLGLLPVLMVWSGRYIQKRESSFTVGGGKWLLAVVFIFSISVISVEIIQKMGLLAS